MIWKGVERGYDWRGFAWCGWNGLHGGLGFGRNGFGGGSGGLIGTGIAEFLITFVLLSIGDGVGAWINKHIRVVVGQVRLPVYPGVRLKAAFVIPACREFGKQKYRKVDRGMFERTMGRQSIPRA